MDAADGSRVGERGYPGYHISDAATVRTLLAGPAPVGAFANVLGVTRQAARKVATASSSAATQPPERNAADGRRVNIALTDSGVAYARAVIDVIGQLNREIAEAVTPDQLLAADAVLRAALDNDPQINWLPDASRRPSVLPGQTTDKPAERHDPRAAAGPAATSPWTTSQRRVLKRARHAGAEGGRLSSGSVRGAGSYSAYTRPAGSAVG